MVSPIPYHTIPYHTSEGLGYIMYRVIDLSADILQGHHRVKGWWGGGCIKGPKEGGYTNSGASDVLDQQNSLYNNSTLPWQEEVDTNTGIMVYAILIGSFFLASMIRSILFFIRCMFSSIKLHNQMFQAIIRAPMLFFERNSAGIIIFS